MTLQEALNATRPETLAVVMDEYPLPLPLPLPLIAPEDALEAYEAFAAKYEDDEYTNTGEAWELMAIMAAALEAVVHE